MADYNTTATTTVIIDGKLASDEMNRLSASADKLRKKLTEAMQSDSRSETNKVRKELKEVERAMRDLQRTTFDVDKVMKNLSGATLNDLYRSKRRLSGQIRDMTRNTKEYINTSKQLRLVEKEISKVSNEMGRARKMSIDLRSAFSMLAPAAIFATAIAGIGRLVKQLPALAMQMEGDNRRASIVFGNSLGYVEAEADKLSKKMGVTRREFIAMSAATADLLIPLDFTREASAKMSVQLQSLSGALSEWTGGKISTALASEILTKAMLGENEQLKQLGIAIKMDSLEFREMSKQLQQAQGLTKAQADAMTTLELIQRKSVDAQTAYNQEGNKLLRWSRDMGRQLRELKEGFINLFAEDVVDKTRQEREEMNNLADYILKTKEGTDARRIAIETFNTKYGKYLENLLTEKSTIEDIRDAQNDANGALVRNIALKEQEGIISKYQKTQSKQVEEILKGVDPGLQGLASSALGEMLKRAIDVAPKNLSYETAMGPAAKEMNALIADFMKQFGIEGPQTFYSTLRYMQLERSKQSELTQSANINAATLGVSPSSLNFFGTGGVGAPATTSGGGLTVGGGAGSTGSTKDTYATMLSSAQSYHNGRLLILKQYLQEEKITQDQHNLMVLEEEVSFLEAKKAIMQQKGEETHEIEMQIIDKQMEMGKAAYEMRKKYLGLSEEDKAAMEQMGKEIFAQIDAEVNAEIELQKKLDELRKEELAKEKEKYEEKLRITMDFAASVGAAIGEQVSNGELTLENFGKTIVKIGLDTLRMLLRQAIFKATIGSLTTADSIATFGATGLARAAVLTGLMEAAFAVVESQMQFAYGRYPITGPDDGKNYNANYVGIPRTGIYSQPSVGLFSEGMPEMVIDGPTTRNLQVNYPGVIDSIMAARQFASGSYPVAAQSTSATQIQQSQAVNQDSKELIATIRELRAVLQSGIQARFGYETTRDIRNKISEIEDIERSVGG